MVQNSERRVLEDYGYDKPARTNAPTPRPAPDLGGGVTTIEPPTLDDVPGWFRPVDRDLFRKILEWQSAHEPAGDIVELGAYLGKSAIVLGQCLKPGETLTVCDLFGMPAPDDANASEADGSYGPLDIEGFKRNYLMFHDALPVVLQMPTSEVLNHVKPDTARFIHVDASHLYEHVALDIESARTMMRPGGIVVFDDYQSLHTPGVAAAVWAAMATAGLKPIALTAKKWYGTWDDPTPIKEMIRAWVPGQKDYRLNVQYIAGYEVLRVLSKNKKADRRAKDAGA
jgi:hypothetical protein